MKNYLSPSLAGQTGPVLALVLALALATVSTPAPAQEPIDPTTRFALDVTFEGETPVPLDGSIWLGSLDLNETAERALFLENTTTLPISVSAGAISVTGDGFRLDDVHALDLRPGETAWLELQVGPFADPVNAEGLLEFTYDGAPSTGRVKLEATAASRPMMAGMVRDVYAEFEAFTRGSGSGFSASLRDLLTRGRHAFPSIDLADVYSPRQGEVVETRINVFVEDGLQRLVMDPSWISEPPATVQALGATLSDHVEQKARLQTEYSRFSRATTFESTVSSGGVERIYRAAMLWGGATRPTLVDEVLDGLEFVVEKAGGPLVPALGPTSLSEAMARSAGLGAGGGGGESPGLAGLPSALKWGRTCEAGMIRKTIPTETPWDDNQHLFDADFPSAHRSMGSITSVCECAESCALICSSEIFGALCVETGKTESPWRHVKDDDVATSAITQTLPDTPVECLTAFSCGVKYCEGPCSAFKINVRIEDYEVRFEHTGITPNTGFLRDYEAEISCQPCRETYEASVTALAIPQNDFVKATLAFEGETHEEFLLEGVNSDSFEKRIPQGVSYLFRFETADGTCGDCTLEPGSSPISGQASGDLTWFLVCDGSGSGTAVACNDDRPSRVTVALEWEHYYLGQGDPPAGAFGVFPVDVQLVSAAGQQELTFPSEGVAAFPDEVRGSYSLLAQPRTGNGEMAFCTWGDGGAYGVADGQPHLKQLTCSQLVMAELDDCENNPSACVAPPTCAFEVVNTFLSVGRVVCGSEIVCVTDPQTGVTDCEWIIHTCNGVIPVSQINIACDETATVAGPTKSSSDLSSPWVYSRVAIEDEPRFPDTFGEISLLGVARDDESGVAEVLAFVDQQPVPVLSHLFDNQTCTEIPSAACDFNSGFKVVLDTTELGTGRHNLEVWAQNGAGVWNRDNRNFTIYEDSTGGGGQTPPAELTVVDDPDDRVASPGDTLVLEVVVAGGTPPYSYEWWGSFPGFYPQFVVLPDSPDAPSLTVGPLGADATDRYYICRVVDAAGEEVWSASALVAVE